MNRRMLILCALAVGIGGLCGSMARADVSREYQIKAAFIYNFVQFVDWPEGTFRDAKAPIVIGILGPDPFAGSFDAAMKGRTVGDRAVLVRHFATAADVTPCQVLFVSAAGDDQFAEAVRKLGPVGLLAVGETEQFVNLGGIIRFYEKGNRIRFQINQNAATQAKLRIRAKLLRLAGEDN
jgi:hypothetical protein